MKLIFEKSVPGRRCTILPPCDVETATLPESLRRETKPDLPSSARRTSPATIRSCATRSTASTAGSIPWAPAP